MQAQKFTYQYHQPPEYHFSLDSVELAYRAAVEIEKEKLKNLKVLDLCSGCGVIGFDFHFYQDQIKELHFLEIQKNEYEKDFQKNLALVRSAKTGSPTQYFSHWINYAHVSRHFAPESFDLILANPPYFEKDQGKHSPSLFKNRCRFYWDSDFPSLVDSILFLLKPGGQCLLLLRPLSNHGKDLNLILEQKCRDFSGPQIELKVLGSIRGTQLLQIKKMI